MAQSNFLLCLPSSALIIQFHKQYSKVLAGKKGYLGPFSADKRDQYLKGWLIFKYEYHMIVCKKRKYTKSILDTN